MDAPIPVTNVSAAGAPAAAAASAPEAPPAAKATGDRVLSVDALRGFDMFWIIGAGSIVTALDDMSANPITNFLSQQLKHSRWEGCTFEDLIFPLFLFLMGVSLVFSLDKALVRDGLAAVMKRIARRSLLLFALGVWYGGGLTERWPDIPLGGVLHRIAMCYFLAATLYACFSARRKTLAGITVGLLVGYWALVTFVPFPDFRINRETVLGLAAQVRSTSPFAIAGAVQERISGVYEEGRNLTNYVDFLFLYVPGGRMPYYINEGLLSTLPAVSICLFGAFAGLLLKDERAAPKRKVVWLLAAGAVMVVLGLLWSLQFPLIKRIWTSSYCLFTAGLSVLLLAGFYFIVDVRQVRMWCRPFVWIGMNSITIYLLASFMRFHKLAERLVGGDIHAGFDAIATGLGGLVNALVGVGLAIMICWFLHSKKIFLRV